MTSERIKEIQDGTAYPESTSVKQALLQVWNECEQEKSKNPIDFNKLRDEFFSECTENKFLKDAPDGYRFRRIVSLAPHDMFEWFKTKLTTKL